MKVSYLVELLKNTNYIYKDEYQSANSRCYEGGEIVLYIKDENNKLYSLSIKSLEDLNKNKEVLNKEISKIESLNGYTYSSKVSLCAENNEYTDNTLGSLFNILKDASILGSSLNNKWIEVIILSSQSKGTYYFKGVEVDLFDKPNPWGWDKLKNMIVKEIKEVNNMKSSFMQIVVSDE